MFTLNVYFPSTDLLDFRILISFRFWFSLLLYIFFKFLSFPMTSSPSPFANGGKLQVLPTPVSKLHPHPSPPRSIKSSSPQTTLLFTQSLNNNTGNSTPFLRQTSTQNGTIIQQPVTSGIMTTPSTSIVRVNQPQQTVQNQGHFVPQTLWANNPSQSPQQQFTLQKTTQPTSVLQYAAIKNGSVEFLILEKRRHVAFP